MVYRRDIYSHAPGLSLLGCDHALCNSQDAGLAAVNDDGRCLLYRGAGGGTGPFGKPNIFYTGQGSQFMSQAFTSVLRDAEVPIVWMAGGDGWTSSS